MMDFGDLQPEINSGRMYAGPGAGSLLAAAAAWDALAADLHSAASAYSSVVSGLTAGTWLGPSSIAMAAAAAPSVAWLTATANQAEQGASQARLAAAAYEAAFAMTVPPPVIAANRALLGTLVATNFFGQNTPAIAATEAHYAEMWAQDAAAMYGYAADSAAAATMTQFTAPPQTTSQAGLAGQAAAVAQAVGTTGSSHAQLTQLMSTISAGLQSLAQPMESTSSTSSALSQIPILGGFLDPSQFVSNFNGIVDAGMYNGASAMAAFINLMSLGVGNAGGNVALGAAGRLGAEAGLLPALGHTSVIPAFPAAGNASVPAGIGQASSVGMLSVPPSWAAATPTMGSAASALPVTAIPESGASAAVPAMMPLGSRAVHSGVVPRYGSRLTVMARPVVGG